MATKITELDFTTIRENLKQYLKSKQPFQDYDFDGSALSVLLDVLAHNTYYQAFYLNMTFSEMFLDSATTRGAVISRAKELGYTPLSWIGAQASLRLTVIPGDAPSFITVPKGTKFKGLLDGNEYVFSTREDVTINRSTSGTYVGDVTVYEGDPTTQKYLIEEETLGQIIRILNKQVDTRTLEVNVRDTASSTSVTPWTLASDILSIDATSKIFFLQQNLQEYFEIQFGDGILGAIPSVGNVIELSYLTTNGSAVDGLSSFTSLDNIDTYSNFTISVLSPAQYGSDGEDIEEMRFEAPRDYTMQKRLVTAGDYRQNILTDFPEVDSISVWGGEDNVVPVYGKVFVALKPSTGLTLSDVDKETIKTRLKERNVLSVDLEFVDPTYIYLIPNIDVRFDQTLTTLSASSVASLVANTVQSYETEYLSSFDKKFYFSKFVTAIDSTDTSIVSSSSTIQLQKRFIPIVNSTFTYSVNFHKELFHPYDGYYGSLKSSEFTLPNYSQTMRMDEDGNGIVRAYYISGASRVYVGNIGTVDYTTGIVTLNNFNPSGFSGSELSITIVPKDKNVFPTKNEIVLFTSTVITIINDTTEAKMTVVTPLTAGDETSVYESSFLTTQTI